MNSSVILAVGYDARATVLEVTFRNGRLYEYVGVPPEEFKALLSADSVGKYFNEEIKPRYPSARVRRSATSSADRARRGTSPR